VAHAHLYVHMSYKFKGVNVGHVYGGTNFAALHLCSWDAVSLLRFMGFNGQLTTEIRGSPPRLCV